MGLQLFTNNADSTMSGSLASAATTLTLFAGGGAKFPTPTAGDYFLLTLYEHDVSNNEENIEIVKCTARTSDTLTIVRNFESGAGVPAGGYAYPTAVGRTVYASLRWTAAGAANGIQQSAIGITVQPYDAATMKTNAANVCSAQQTDNSGVQATTIGTGARVVTGGLSVSKNLALQGKQYGYDTTGGAATTVAESSTTSLATVTSSPVDFTVTASYRSARYLVQITQGSNYRVSEVFAVHDGTTAYYSESHVVYSSIALANVSVDVSGGNLRLMVEMNSSAPATVKVAKLAIAV